MLQRPQSPRCSRPLAGPPSRRRHSPPSRHSSIGSKPHMVGREAPKIPRPDRKPIRHCASASRRSSSSFTMARPIGCGGGTAAQIQELVFVAMGSHSARGHETLIESVIAAIHPRPPTSLAPRGAIFARSIALGECHAAQHRHDDSDQDLAHGCSLPASANDGQCAERASARSGSPLDASSLANADADDNAGIGPAGGG